MTKPAPTNPSKKRVMASVAKLLAIAKQMQRMPLSTRSTAYIRRGPSLSTSIPTKMRAGMVSATLMIRSAPTCSLERPIDVWIAAINGA